MHLVIHYVMHQVMLAFPPADYAGAELGAEEGGGMLTELVS